MGRGNQRSRLGGEVGLQARMRSFPRTLAFAYARGGAVGEGERVLTARRRPGRQARMRDFPRTLARIRVRDGRWGG